MFLKGSARKGCIPARALPASVMMMGRIGKCILDERVSDGIIEREIKQDYYKQRSARDLRTEEKQVEK